MTQPETHPAAVSLTEVFLRPFMKLAAVQPGERVLDITCGNGEAAIEAALRAGSSGEVLAIDTRPEALEAVRARARATGVPLPRTALMDPARLELPDAYWDVALSHLGLPSLADPEAAFKEVCRVLRPVGRFAVSALGERDRCPLLTIFLDAVARHFPAAGATAFELFRYSDPGKLARLLAEHGFEDAVPDRSTEWVPFRDVDHYWQSLATTTLAHLTAQLSTEAVTEIKADIERRTRFYRRGGGLEIKIEAITLAAVK